jgi:hypothetical protein
METFEMPKFRIEYHMTVVRLVEADDAEEADDMAWEDVPYPDIVGDIESADVGDVFITEEP